MNHFLLSPIQIAVGNENNVIEAEATNILNVVIQLESASWRMLATYPLKNDNPTNAPTSKASAGNEKVELR